jgi:starvation-inducible DNA-binding protein
MHMQPTPAVGFTTRARTTVASILNHALAEELLLSSATRSFSGTVPSFLSLHRLFVDQYHQLERWVDQLASCTWALGPAANAASRMDELATARCVTLEERVPVGTMVSELLVLHEKLAERLREDVKKCSQTLGDPSTADVLARLVEFHETTAWMLRMVLQGPEPARV